MKKAHGKESRWKRDVIFIIGLLALSVAAYVVVQLTHHGGQFVTVTVDGVTTGRYSLSQDITFSVNGYDGGYNNVVIKDGAVYLEDADCPDKLCVKTGHISKTGKTIVCLPHRVVVEITGGDSTDESDVIDSIAR